MGIAGIGWRTTTLHLHIAVIHLRQGRIYLKGTDNNNQCCEIFHRIKSHDTTTSRNMPASIWNSK